MTASATPLFETPLNSPLGDAVGWLGDALFGTVAVTLCVLAVAMVGLLMLTGRLPVRQGLRTVLGCFILLGAPAIAAGFMTLVERRSPPPAAQAAPADPRGDLNAAE